MLEKVKAFMWDLVQSNGKLSSTKFFLTLFNLSLLAIIWHKELTQPDGVSSELLVVAFGLLAGNYQVSKLQRFKALTQSKDPSNNNDNKEKKDGEQ